VTIAVELAAEKLRAISQLRSGGSWFASSATLVATAVARDRCKPIIGFRYAAGTNFIENTLPAYPRCNQRKALLTEKEFRARLAAKRSLPEL
jgi:hypothetical protein